MGKAAGRRAPFAKNHTPSVLIGGTAASLHAKHRVSLDGDHFLAELRENFDEVLRQLEAASGWQTSRVQKPVLILGTLEGVLTGVRQLRRAKPLETETIEGLRVPTLHEMATHQSVVARHALHCA